MAIFSKEYLENLNEQTIYSEKIKKNKGYCIFNDMQEGRNFEKEPYIKVYNNVIQNDATELVRVSMITGAPLKTEHTNRGKDAGRKRLKFTKEVAQFLTKAMYEKPNEYTYPDNIETVYDAIYYEIYRRTGIEVTKYPIPDFERNIEK